MKGLLKIMNLHELTSIIVQALFAFIFILGFITIVILLVVNILCKEEKTKTDNINNDNNDDFDGRDPFEIDKYYIMKTYGDELIYPLMGQERKNKNVYSFYINKNNAMDIKLPYEFLSPIKTLESNKGHVLFELNVDDNYEHFLIHPTCGSTLDNNLSLGVNFGSGRSSGWLTSENYRYFSALNYSQGISYNFTRNHDINERVLQDDVESSDALFELINTYNLNSESLIKYYIALIKKNQPTVDELIDILIKFEKAKEEIDRVKIIDQNQTLNTMLENSVSHKDNQFDSIDKELMSLVNSNKKDNKNKRS